MELKKIAEEIKKAQNIVLTIHTNSDGDCIGSAIALMLILDRYNKKNFSDEIYNMKTVRLVLDDKLPRFMDHFKERALVEYYPNFKMKNIDLLIAIDSANIERIGNVAELRKESKKMINIDHHISNTKYADINYVDDVSSTSEIIYRFLELFDVELDKEIATFLYLGIINDTGNFSHSNVTSDTFMISSELVKAGIDNSEITDILFGVTLGKARLLGEVYKNLIIDEELKFAYYYLSDEKAEELKIGRDETDGMSEILLDLVGIEVSLFLKDEKNGRLKGSLRSKSIYDVNEVGNNFGGGGHKKAAGFNTDETPEKVIEKIKELLEKQLTKK
jgi:phosphoesterase RecJ-like protein